MYAQILNDVGLYYAKSLTKEKPFTLTRNIGTAPYGYKFDYSKKCFLLIPSEADVVRRIFDMYVHGDTYTEIIDALNSEGIVTRRKNKFTQPTLNAILHNRKYAGIYEIDLDNETYFIDNAIPQIISVDTFNETQRRLLKNHNSPQVYKAIEPYILSGKIFCSCGQTLCGNRRTSKSGHTWSGYRCSSRKIGASCGAKEIKKTDIESRVMQIIESEIFNEENIKDMAVEIYHQNQANLLELENTITDQRENLKTLKQTEKTVITAAERKGVEIRLAATQTAITSLDKAIKTKLTVPMIVKYLKQYQRISVLKPELQKHIIELFVDKIVVSDDEVSITLILDEPTI